MIETRRLTLRPFAEEDRAAFRALLADPRVTGDAARVVPREDADALFDFYRACWDEDGVAYAAVERRDDGAVIGMAGLALSAADPAAERLCEIGWALAPDHWGAGYAAEAATAWLTHGFDVLRLRRIHALIWSDNARSLRLMATLGFVPDLDFVHPDGAEADRRAFVLTPALWFGRAARIAGA